MVQRPRWVEAWFSTAYDFSVFQINRLSLASSSTWALSNGVIRHQSGQFFNIIGVQWENPNGKCIMQPLIEQREIGTLGFLLRSNEKNRELLVQAKIEPGNVGIVQLAPTCQATASNISRIHGGKSPPFCELFPSDKTHIISDSLQSEQGTRFLRKHNRNILATVANPILTGDTHRWLRVDEVLELLKFDTIINTDARSVLICSQWEMLVDRAPFARYCTPFGIDLAHSAIHGGNHKSITRIHKELMSLSTKISTPEIVPLEKLDDWAITDEGVIPIKGKPFIIRHIQIITDGREVPAWDQPIIDSVGQGHVELVCGRIDGVLHFLFRPQIEIGLYKAVELGPTMVVEPGEELPGDTSLNQSGATVIIECLQSDEGGRFYQDITLYRVFDVGEAYEVPADWQWLTLKQIQILLQRGGCFTNEARSALSLILTWL
ncbi:NDP-hexose 2,3-dehydratase family protein [Chloroflexota bacterium]